MGFIWLQILNLCLDKSKIKSNEYLESKISTAKYFFDKELIITSYLKENILSGASNYNDYKDSYFDTGFKL